jgi:hypothetical protein
MEDPVDHGSIWPGLYLYLLYLQDLIRYLSSKPPRLWASWPVPLGRVGQLMVGPLFLSVKSRRRGTHGTKPRQSDNTVSICWESKKLQEHSTSPWML